MKLITPISLTLTNFLPFTNEKIIFPVSSGLKMLTGENRIDKLGANGAGKSALFEGINFALYGTGIKGKKLSGLVTWEEKECTVVFEFSINTKNYIIKRYGPPMRLELDGKPVEQREIDSLVGLSKDRFAHSVIFGQGVKLFPDLSISERADLFDSVLDLSIWARCVEASSTKCSQIEMQINKLKIDLAYVEGKLNSFESEEYLENQIKVWEDEQQSRLDKLEIEANQWDEEQQRKINEINQQVEDWKSKLVDRVEAIDNKIKELELEKPVIANIQERENQLTILDNNINIQADLESQARLRYKQTIDDEQFWANDSCPSCRRKITKEEKEEKIQNAMRLKQEFESIINQTYNRVVEFRSTRKNLLEEVQEIKVQTEKEKRINSLIQLIQIEAEGLLAQYDSGNHPYVRQLSRLTVEPNPYFHQKMQIRGEANPHTERLILVKKERQTLQTQKDELTKQYKDLEKQLMSTTYWKSGFKRIRLFFVQQVLLALQVEIKASLSALGLEGWNISLATETETKSGTTKLGIQIHVKSRTAEAPWEGWSGGEAQRLRLAIAQGLGNLIQRGAGVWWSIQVLDEPTNFLSGEGIADLLSYLEDIAEVQKKQIWLVDHRSLEHGSFNEVWSVIKTEEGSKVYKVS